jgi:hypothetical protein
MYGIMNVQQPSTRSGVLLLLLTAVPAAAQEPTDDTFWEDKGRIAAGAAAEIVGLRDPLLCVPLVVKGNDLLVWDVGPAPAPSLHEQLLRQMKDGNPLPARLGDRPRDEWKPWERVTFDLYSQAFRQAATTAPEAFARSARANQDVTYGEMYGTPAKFRGRIIPVKGRLRRLMRSEPPLDLFKKGIKECYEAWVFTPAADSNPVRVDVPRLPEGLRPPRDGEKIDRPVSFNGYFLTRFKYESDKGPRETLLFIAPTLEVDAADGKDAAAPQSAAELWKDSLPYLVAVFAAVVLLAMGLGWWFRRDDARYHARIAKVRASNPFPAEDRPQDGDTEPKS